MSKQTLIRCGEKNNFNFTAAEIEQLKGFADSGKIFVNSNSFVNITADHRRSIHTVRCVE